MLGTKSLCIAIVVLVMAPGLPCPSTAAGRSYQECQARAVSLGISTRYSQKVFRDYERFKAAGTAIRPRGFIARCMAGKD